MTTINVPRELLERLALPPASSSGWTEWNTAVAYEAARELRALLAEQPQAGTDHFPDATKMVEQPQAGAGQALSDADIEAAFTRAGGKWDGDKWVIEDADLHPFARSMAASPTTHGKSVSTVRGLLMGLDAPGGVFAAIPQSPKGEEE